jgi:hypothetical protein
MRRSSRILVHDCRDLFQRENRLILEAEGQRAVHTT